MSIRESRGEATPDLFREKMDRDDDLVLSEHALNALQEFYQEREKQIEINNHVGALEEDWELSQFWYDKNTALTLGKAALNAAGETGRIACISCPTVYTHLLNLTNKTDSIYLFEYDKRFQDLYQDHFIYYNYNDPLKVPDMFKSYFDVVLADPPYLSEECLEKTLQTVKHLAKDKIILCTGAVMEDLAYKLLMLKPCIFQPQHNRKLGNEFKCYTNWNVDYFIQNCNENSNKL